MAWTSEENPSRGGSQTTLRFCVCLFLSLAIPMSEAADCHWSCMPFGCKPRELCR